MDVAGISMGIVAASDTAFLAANQSMADLLELSVDQLTGRLLTEFRIGPTGDIRQALINNNGAPAQYCNIELLTALGAHLHVDATLALYGTFRDVSSILVIVADASVRVEAQNQARRLIEAADEVTDLVAIHDLRLGTLLYCNRAFTSATGYSAGDRDDPIRGMIESQASIIATEIIPTVLESGAWSGTIQAELNGQPRWLSGTIVGERSNIEQTRLRYITSVLTDITSDHERAVVLEYEAIHDRLTGLSNRSGVVRHLAAQPDDAAIAICHLDLDRFQEINDVLGHEVGDRVLRDVARRLEASTRPIDLVGRINGDEFVVVFADIEGPQHALLLADRLKSEIFDRPIVVDGHPIKTTASFGLSVSGTDFTGESLLRAADVALYRAKNLGRSHIEVYTAELQIETVRRSKLIEDLRDALHNEQLTVWYQPIVSFATGQIVSVEALVRWPHDDGTFTPPDEFIQLAESVGLVMDVDRFVLRRALDDIGALIRGGNDLEVHVNLSATRLTDDSLPAEVSQALTVSNYAPERLCLELTETALALDRAAAELIVSKLADLGIRLAVDDFGTGYSSLASLHRYRLHVLKIDRSFVQLLDENNGKTNPIIGTIVGLAASLGLEVVAEGIETESQRAYFANTSAAFGQGYLFHAPMPIEDLRALLPGRCASMRPKSSRSHRVKNRVS